MPPLRHEKPALSKNEDVWCIKPSGEIRGWDYSDGRRDAQGQPIGTCPAPARFVRVPICGDGQMWHDETPDVWAARGAAGRDGSLHGDHYKGLWFCIPMPPR